MGGRTRGARDSGRTSRSRSHSNTARPDYKIETEGLDIKDADIGDNDDDYNEDDIDDKDAEYSENDADDDTVTTSRRSRPPKRKLEQDEDEEEEEEAEQQSESERSVSATAHVKRTGVSRLSDENGLEIPVIDDEYDFVKDPEGEKKITPSGDLIGDREFNVRTFPIFDRGDIKYMLATEPARAVGYRDSTLFFHSHPNLYKVMLNQAQKNDLIERSMIPYSYRSRNISVVTARSVFREFGHKIITDGKVNTDDYYESISPPVVKIIPITVIREAAKRASAKHHQRHAIEKVDPADAIFNPAKNTVEFFERKNTNANITPGSSVIKQMNSTNWLYQHGAACSRFNSDMYYDRVRVLLIEQQGLRDPYTNTLHLPQLTQPSKVIDWYKLDTDKNSNNSEEMIFETLIKDEDLTKTNVGLANIPKEIYEDVVDEQTKKAIEEQISFEKKLDI